MLTLEYLRNRLNGNITAIYKAKDQIIESAGGYDGIIALIQTKNISPMIILENSEIGEFSFQPGGCNKKDRPHVPGCNDGHRKRRKRDHEDLGHEG